jgi:hypothetical protein
VLDAIVAAEGGAEEETGYDGRKLAWTQEAKKALRAIDDRYQRRRAKARIEKAAHGQRLQTITLDLAARFIEEETGVLYKSSADPEAASRVIAEAREAMDALHGRDGGEPAAAGAAPAAEADEAGDDDPELKILARDAQGTPLVSRLAWSDDAIARVLRVPGGYMRDKTQARIEELAAEQGVAAVDLALVEDGIEHGKRLMVEMMAGYQAQPPAGSAGAKPANGGDGESAAAANGESCPVDHEAAAANDEVEAEAGELPSLALNEVSVMSASERRRREMQAQAGADEP